MRTLPSDAVSLSHYGYTVDPTYMDSRARVSSYNPGRQSRLSIAPSQVFFLPPDPNNKDPNQPVQLLVVQQEETGLSPLSITTIVAYSFLALHSIVFEEVYALYAVTPVVSHGLGWTAIQLSSSLAFMGIIQLLTQFVVYPMLERRFSAVWLFRIAQLLYCCVYISFPLIRAFVVDESDTERGGQAATVRYLVLGTLVFKFLCSVFSYTSIMVMVCSKSNLVLHLSFFFLLISTHSWHHVFDTSPKNLHLTLLFRALHIDHKLITTTLIGHSQWDRSDISLVHAGVRSSARRHLLGMVVG
jgi:hypothetical protein